MEAAVALRLPLFIHIVVDYFFKIPFQRLYICSIFGSRMSGIKREVRCKSGAIPVAVRWVKEWVFSIPMIIVRSPLSHCWIFIPLFRNAEWEGVQQKPSQKTCQVHLIIRKLSG